MEIDLKNRFKSKELDIKDNYIHIISSLIIIISEIICQNENENFSEFNFYSKVIGSIIMNNLYKNPQIAWKGVFSSVNINLTQI